MESQRKFQRISFRNPIRYQVVQGLVASTPIDEDLPMIEESNPVQSFGGFLSCDLSAGGIRSRCADFLPARRAVWLNFGLDDQRQVELGGRIVWVTKAPNADYYHIGIEFDHSPANAQRISTINEYVAEQSAGKEEK